MTLSVKENINEYADYWRKVIGVNVIPADTANKRTYEKWSEWQTKPIPDELHEQWKKDNAFSKGIAIVLGKVWHRPDRQEFYFVFIDLDNQKAIDEVCSVLGAGSIQELAQYMVVEQHQDNLSKAHLYFYSNHQFKKKSSDVSKFTENIKNDEIPAIEVKGLGEHGIAYCTPSPHKNGYSYEIIGTREPKICGREVEEKLEEIYRKYNLITGSDYCDKVPIERLFSDDCIIYKGNNRHEATLRICESLIRRNIGILSEEQITKLAYQWNQKHCNPPLEDGEFEKQLKSAKEFIAKKSVEVNGKNSTSDSNEDSKEYRNTAEVIAELAQENIHLLFKDQYNTAFAQVSIKGNRQILRVESDKFKRYLFRLYQTSESKFANKDAINSVVSFLHSKAEYEGKTIPLSLRVAWHDGNIYYDLTDEKGQCVKISKHGWTVENQTPIPLFVKYNQIPQVFPDSNYPSNIFDQFFDLTNILDDSSRLLIKVYVISLFIPDIPHTMLILHGEKGSAKSTLQSLIKMLVDPSKPLLLTLSKDRQEFIQQLAHNHIAFYDNIKHTPGWLSDEACKAVTGVGQTKRKLYSDDEDIVYEYKRCLGFNGINIALSEPDALDRSIMIEVNRITRKNRRQESEILEQFQIIKPKLLAYIFDILTKVLQIKPRVKLDDLPRMADFTIWGEAIARAMGFNPLHFVNAYYDNIGKQNIEAIEDHPISRAIVRCLDKMEEEGKRPILEGSALEVLEVLELFSEQKGVNSTDNRWTKTSHVFSRRLKQIQSNLLEGLGIEILISRNTKRNGKTTNTSIVKIWKPYSYSENTSNRSNNSNI